MPGSASGPTVYVGTSEFAAVVLERLAASERRPALVISRPDRPRGRGRRLAAPPVADRARELGIELLQPADPNDGLGRIRELAPAVLLVCAYGALIREPLLSSYPILNLHPSLLPRWRGAAPIERAIRAGDGETGVSIMRLTAGLDSGPVCLQQAEKIAPDDDYGTLAERLQEVGAALLLRVLSMQAPVFSEQDESRVTYAEKIGAADRVLDASRPAEELARVVRALHPHIGARTPDGLRVLKARPAAGGELRFGPLELLCVQPPGGRPMDAAAYLRGHAR
ncbi:MAG: methionyl-tRNA formyltransferase [Solirubrobacteraceae bacterium]